LRSAIAKSLGLDPDAVTVIHHQGAGCYGHNGADDAAYEAAFIAQARPGRTVRILWTREDELSAAPFGPAMVVRIKAGLDGAYRPISWSVDIWSPPHGSRPGMNGSINLLMADALEPGPDETAVRSALQDGSSDGAVRNAVTLYQIPHQVVTHHFIPTPPVRTSSLRGLGAFVNVFALECFMDDISAQAAIDPVTYRLSLLSDPRARRVIETASEMAGWWDAAPVPGTALGFAFSRYKNVAAYVAIVVEVSVQDEVQLNRVWCAVDGGLIINPDGARNQIEGGIIQAASWTLKEKVRFGEGCVVSDRWEHYPILRFSEVPEIELRLVGNDDDLPLGIGEVSQGPTAAAVGNAVARALGAKLRHLPLTRERIISALLEEAGC